MEIASGVKQRMATLIKDPHFKTVTISTGSGAIILGGVGGAFGTASGVVVGTTLGALPALFTFGLSLPVGAAVGGGVGGAAGVVVGGSTGAMCGGAAGYRYRVEIKEGVIYVKAKAVESVQKTRLTILDAGKNLKAKVNATALSVKDKSVAAKKKLASKLAAAWTATTNDRTRLQVSAASAVGGAAVLAPVGGAVGACTGTVAGGIVGLVPALFTFGLSIPVCAVIGGGMGLCAGTATGGCAGVVGGSTIGFGGYTYRKEVSAKYQETQQTIKNKVAETTKYARDKVEAVKARVSGTGGTA